MNKKELILKERLFEKIGGMKEKAKRRFSFSN